MTRMLALTLLRQRLSSPMRVLFLGVIALGTVVTMAFTGLLSPLGQVGPLLAVAFSAGLIGQEVSSGTLQIALARPVSRRRYVLSRWLGAVLGVAIVGTLIELVGVPLMLRAHPGTVTLTPAALGVAWLQVVLDGAATASVIAALSACVTGLGDLAILLLAYTLLPMIGQLAVPYRWNAVTQVLAVVQPLLAPRFALGFLAGTGTVQWSGLANGAGVLLLGLGIAIAVLNHRELSYGGQ